MSLPEFSSDDCINMTPLIDYLNVFPSDQLQIFENVTIVQVPETNYEIKVGYEEIVYPNLDLPTTPPPPIYEDISDDESTDSLSSMYTSLPKCITDWTCDHIMTWILELYDTAEYRYEDLNLHHFNKRDGTYLMQLTEADWEQIDKKRSKWLFEKVQLLIQQSKKKSSASSNNITYTIVENSNSDEDTDPYPPRRKRGRPPKMNAKRRPEQKIGRVWEFLRNLLQNPEYCPSLIYWEDYKTKKFRLVDGQKVAELWGKRKNNPNMNYEKFSRTIRHYYKDNVIISVPKEKLVYRFGVNARGIDTDNPNFGKPVNLR